MDNKTLLIFILIVIASLMFSLSYERQQENNEIGTEASDDKVFTYSRSMMDTIVTITIIENSEEQARRAASAAFENISRIDVLMNGYDNSSQLSTLNHDGQLLNGDQDLVNVIERSIYHSQISQGAFDITIKPVLDLWKSKFSPGGTYQPPNQTELDRALALVNSSRIDIQENDIYMEPGMSIVLGGIAKGYAVDAGIESLKQMNVENCFVDAGGDGRYSGLRIDGTAWKVGLQDPDKKTGPITVIEMQDMAVATSGNYERYFNESAKVSHISDPRTGYSAENLISATVIAKKCIDADALATSVFILGEEKGMDLIESLEDTECLLITPERNILKSSGFENYESASY